LQPRRQRAGHPSPVDEGVIDSPLGRGTRPRSCAEDHVGRGQRTAPLFGWQFSPDGKQLVRRATMDGSVKDSGRRYRPGKLHSSKKGETRLAGSIAGGLPPEAKQLAIGRPRMEECFAVGFVGRRVRAAKKKLPKVRSNHRSSPALRLPGNIHDPGRARP